MNQQLLSILADFVGSGSCKMGTTYRGWGRNWSGAQI